ncbi:9239_t:CDS:2 [Acaulospora morrowiae]|uniref:9239_t:CDS:1 n=1 Tax=Acaulospora morrowiae TaxID=94023 RepID=A0A9N8VZZ1_9GLOM|nr:9239_t:CDS:2 [Acaulospora morrowiae]
MHNNLKRGGRFKTQFQDRSGRGRGRSPNRNDDNSSSPGQLNLFASHGVAMNRTPSPQGERNKERGISQEEIDKRNARAERFGIQLNPSQRRNAGGKVILDYKKAEVKEPPPDPIVDFLKVVEDYVKTQTLIRKIKENRQTNNNRAVAWDFFHEELCPITLESLYRNDKGSQQVDPSDEEDYITEGNRQKEGLKGDEVPSTPRFFDVEMEDVHQFLTSPLPSSPGFRIFESMDVDEAFPSSPSLTPQAIILLSSLMHFFVVIWCWSLIDCLPSLYLGSIPV